MEKTTQQAVNPHPINFMEALFDAVNLAVSSGQNYQLAVGLGTEQAVKMEDQVYNSWKFSLTKSQQFFGKVKGYESWMSVNTLRNMERSEKLAGATGASITAAKNSLASLEQKITSIKNMGRWNSQKSALYGPALSQLKENVTRAEKNGSSPWGSDNFSTEAEVKSAFSKMIQRGTTSQINGAYLNHQLSKATLSQLAAHVAAAPTSQLTVLNTLYGEAQRQQQQQVQQADSGVQADQNQLTQISSNNQQKTMLVSSANSLMSLCANGAIQ